MARHSKDATQLRQLAAKCRRLAGNMTDENSVAELRQMALEYEAKAAGLDRQFQPQPQARMDL